LFDEDKEVVCFSSPEELKSKCNFYLKNENLRERIARAGYDRLISSSYTLEARLRYIMKYAEGYLK
jgi:spore maturation protein CgeB